MNDTTIKNRFAAACQQFDIENAVSTMELNAALSLRNDNVEPYNLIPEHVAIMIKRLIDHNKRLQDILFHGEKEIDFSDYMQKKKSDQTQLDIVLKSLNNI